MISLKFVVFVFSVLAVVVASQKLEPIEDAYKSLAQEEIEDFLTYILGLGLKDTFEDQGRLPKFFPKQDELSKQLKINKERFRKFEAMGIPKESRKKYLEWSKKEFDLTTRDIVSLVKTRKCSVCYKRDFGVQEICCPW